MRGQFIKYSPDKSRIIGLREFQKREINQED